jgi:hypothetical protein
MLHSARFFAAAEDQLSAEKGTIRLTSIQARLAQCFYLLSHSRLNHCWSLFGTTAHLMLALGIHRKTRIDPNSHPDYVEAECRKRTFWCAYNLDTYLSAALGRPRTFHDEDIDQEIPLCVDDHKLQRGATAPPTVGAAQSIMSGSCAHIKLDTSLSSNSWKLTQSIGCLELLAESCVTCTASTHNPRTHSTRRQPNMLSRLRAGEAACHILSIQTALTRPSFSPFFFDRAMS